MYMVVNVILNWISQWCKTKQTIRQLEEVA